MTTFLNHLRTATLCAWLGAAALSGTAKAQTSLTLGFTPVAVFTSAYVAKEEGFFAKRGLDVTLQMLPNSAVLPSAVQSGSIQIAAPTPSVFIQAVDGGLELVGLAGAGVNPKDDAEAALLVRADSAITDPKGLVGKRVAVPGLNALLHVLLRRWFIDNGVDPKKITFVEASFPQMGDILKGGTVDAVVSAGPLKDNILRSGVGKNLLAFGTSIPEGQTFGFYIATRDWAAKNPAVVKAFQEAIAEGAAFTQANPQAARVHIGKYVKVPPPVLAAMAITPQNATLTPAQLSWWVTEMRRQDMLRGNPDTSRLIVK